MKRSTKRHARHGGTTEARRRRIRRSEGLGGAAFTSNVVPRELIDPLAHDIQPETTAGERCLRLLAPPDRGYE